ncbi:hypothetical protein BU16DRAFT_598523 [Lophium mytilinum]|uniref:Uncharacterized protein n=1 Tax=Lophium mytilinum TaxID=390894 RepID=A0A6A6QBP2_9PEZI|nr:hypothetical protein BU16DRAFT_598523 [Lophium mytilinum]
MPIHSSQQQSYDQHIDTLRAIIADDHFGGQMPSKIIDAWLEALNPSSLIPLPPGVNGFYGGSVKASLPIEVARASYKFIAHETTDKEKVTKYAQRMLVALSVLDLDQLAQDGPNLAALALWHQSLALVRLPDAGDRLADTFRCYEGVRPRSNLNDSKLPQPERLRIRLHSIADDLGYERFTVA